MHTQPWSFLKQEALIWKGWNWHECYRDCGCFPNSVCIPLENSLEQGTSKEESCQECRRRPNQGELAQGWWHHEQMALASLCELSQLLWMRWDLLDQGPSDPVREALRWSETHSSSYLSNALVAVGIKKEKKLIGLETHLGDTVQVGETKNFSALMKENPRLPFHKSSFKVSRVSKRSWNKTLS